MLGKHIEKKLDSLIPYAKDITWTDEGIRDYISIHCPGATLEEKQQIRDNFMDRYHDLDLAIMAFLYDRRARQWQQSNEKHYYKVKMLNGGTKFVYMCEEQAKASREGEIFGEYAMVV